MMCGGGSVYMSEWVNLSEPRGGYIRLWLS